MRYLEQKPGPFWWTRNIRYFIYFVREIAGIMLGLSTLTIIWCLFQSRLMSDQNISMILETITFYSFWIAMGSSIIHSFTWLHAIPRIMPFTLSRTGQKLVYLILLAVWIGLSWLAIVTIFAPISHA